MDNTNQQPMHNLIVGLGVTGLSVAHYLAREGLVFSVVDSRENPPGKNELLEAYPFVETCFGTFEESMFLRSDRLIVSPGIPVSTPIIQKAKENGAEIIGDIELFVREANAPIVAITGSNGKSSVTTLVAEMAEKSGLRAYAGGNLGTTALALLDLPVPDLYVMELSSFQLETTHSLQAASAVILNVCEDHMDRYDRYDDYVAAKRVIYQHTKLAVTNRDDEVAAELPASMTASSISFGMSEPQDGHYGLRHLDQRTYLSKGSELLLALDEMKLSGLHNALNALAALALLDNFNLPKAALLAAICQFEGLPHRTQWIAEQNGVRWFNDSKGTNVGATIAALSGFSNKTVLIAGGQGKGADFSPLHDSLLEHARAVVLIGEDKALIQGVVPEQISYSYAEDMSEAVRIAADFAQQGDNVLLSPACASFDMFNSFVHRGQVFTDTVKAFLAEQQTKAGGH